MTDLTRRRFIRGLAYGTVAVSAGLSLSACNDSADADPVAFLHGVASGDPLADRVIIWTRVTPLQAGDIIVDWELATDAAFSGVLRSGRYVTGAARDHTVKVDVTGLAPDQVYYYRFRVDDLRSPVGRTRTLPVGAVDRVRLAVFSCSNFPAGWFHVYAEAARLEDLHAAVHLGDYSIETMKAHPI